MSIQSTAPAIQSLNIPAVQEMVSESVRQTTSVMVTALMLGMRERLDFKGLAEKNIHPELNEELRAHTQKVQMVYQKLFSATKEHIINFSPPLMMTFEKINAQTGKPESADLFLGSFVLSAAKKLVDKLTAEQSAALASENKDIWN
jgi:hypothetical protein